MSAEESSFYKSINELIEIFKILRQRAEKEGISENEKAMFDQFDRIIGDYKLMSNGIPPEFIDEAGKPFRLLLSGLVEKLKAEMGISVENEDIHKTSDTRTMNYEDELKKIEKQLQLAENENDINMLLDKRAKILAALNSSNVNSDKPKPQNE